MPLFNYKKNRVIPILPPTPPRQNVYNNYSDIIPSPPPPPFIEDANSRRYSKNIRRQFKEHDDIEKYNHQKFLLDEAEKLNKSKLSYSRLFCCLCFPCLPMWTRTICCLIFLGLCGIIGITTFFIMTFKEPQIIFNGPSQQKSSNSNTSNLQFEYSVYNGNFFEFNFDSIKAVIYYPTPNKTTIGVGEIDDLVLGPQTVTNITFPVKMMGDGYYDGGLNPTTSKNDSSRNSNDEAFTDMVINSCKMNGNVDDNKDSINKNKEIVVVFDLMPTVKIYGYSIVTLAFTGQNTKMSCEKLISFIENKKNSDKRIGID